MSEDLIEKYARVMGAKTGEVLEVVPVDDGHAVRTHDGQWTLVRDTGVVGPCQAPELTVERDAGVVEVPSGGIPGHLNAGETVKPAAKRRGRS